jgi:HPt (histidine-containing phosphotransfer) domain-containing protein
MERQRDDHRKALVVDEHAADRDAGVAILTWLDYRAEATSCARDALARVGQGRFALVLLSSTLPDMASELTEQLGRLAAPKPLSIVVVHPHDHDQGEAYASTGVIGHVRRPVDGAALLRLLEPPQEPVVDMEHLLSFTDGDLELESELSVLFLSSAEAYFDNMSRCLQSGTAWSSSAHALKGASANLGARRLAALARTAEHHPPAAADLQVIRRAIDEVSAFFGERQRVGSAPLH